MGAVVVAQAQNHALGPLVEGVGLPGHALAVFFFALVLPSGGHAQGTDALLQGGLELFEGAGRVLLGDGVHEGTQGAGEVGLGLGAGGGYQPVQRGVVDGFQTRGRERDGASPLVGGVSVGVVFRRVVGGAGEERLGARQRQQAPPLLGGCTGRLHAGQAGQGARCGVEAEGRGLGVQGGFRVQRVLCGVGGVGRVSFGSRRAGRVLQLGVLGAHGGERILHEGAAQLRHERAQGGGAAHAGDGYLGRLVLGVGGHHEVEELAGGFVLVAHGGQHQAGAGSGRGNGEHAQLVVAGVAHALGVATDARGRHLLPFCLCVRVSGGGAAHPGVADVD